MIRFAPPDFYLFEPLIKMTQVSIYLNFALGIFNLLPLPPLDGSKMIESFLSYDATRKYEQLAQYSFFILMALLLTGALRVLMVPISFMAQITISVMASLFGLSGMLQGVI
jgi:Zn-dependent protease